MNKDLGNEKRFAEEMQEERVLIYFSFKTPDDLLACAKAIAPWTEKIVPSKYKIPRGHIVRRLKRQTMLLNYLFPSEEVSMTKLGTRMERGYGYSYRTFQRDIKELSLTGKISIRRENEGTKGYTTYIKLREKQ